MTPDVATPTRLWDLPTRLTHWAIALLIPLAWLTAENEVMSVHRYIGYALLALVIFRIFWGFVGGSTARFSHFVKGPKAVVAYGRTLLRRAPSNFAGHNPVGALSVVALLAALVAQIVFGLFAVDTDGLESGPLALHVSYDVGRDFADLHEATFNILVALIVLHLGAVAWYLVFKRENLIGAMLTGGRRLGGSEGLRSAPAWRAVLGIALAVAVAWFVSKGLKL